MRVKFLILGVLCCHQVLVAQKIDIESQKYIGKKNGSYEFFQYQERTGLIKPHIVNYQLNSDSIFNEQSHDPWYSEETKILSESESEIELFYHYRDNKLRVKIGERDSIYTLQDDINVFGNNFLATLPNSDSIFISSHSEASLNIFNKKTFEFTALPIMGSNLYVRGNYLFFEAPRYSDFYSSFPKDVYRVKVDDLKNPEKVLIQVNKWYPYSENILYASTDPFLRLNEKKTYGFYNIKDGTVAESPGIATQDIIEIKNKPFFLKIEEKSGEKVFKLEDIPKPTNTFPYQVSETGNQQPRGNIFQWYNIPLNEKKLPGTFVTHELLYEAPISELKTLTKAQLRILRNTFFAFQGYKFISEDLTNFFNQFDWYQKIILGEKSNDDVIIWPDEKERIRLIKEIEDSK